MFETRMFGDEDQSPFIYPWHEEKEAEGQPEREREREEGWRKDSGPPHGHGQQSRNLGE